MNHSSHPPARAKKSWLRALFTATFAFLFAFMLGGVAKAQTVIPVTITGGNLTENSGATVFRATVSAQQYPIRVNFHFEGNGNPSADVDPNDVNSNTNPSASSGFDFDTSRSSFVVTTTVDPNTGVVNRSLGEQSITIAANNAASPDFRIAAFNDGVAEIDEGFRIVVDSFTANPPAGTTIGNSGNGIYNFSINGQSPTRGRVELLQSDTLIRADACGIGDKTLGAGVCENQVGSVANPNMAFNVRLISSEQYNNGPDQVIPYTVYVDVIATAPVGSDPILASQPQIVPVIPATSPVTFSVNGSGNYIRLAFPPGTLRPNLIVPFVMLNSGNDNLPPVFTTNNGASNFQVQAPKVIQLTANIADIQTVSFGYASPFVSTNVSANPATVDRYDPHGLAIANTSTNFITSEDPSSPNHTADVAISLRGVNVPYSTQVTNGVTTTADVVEPFIRNFDFDSAVTPLSYNTDASPKQDTTITFETSNSAEGQLSYYVLKRGTDNKPTGNPIFIQSIPQATPIVVRFVLDPNSPEFYGNYHYIRVTGVDDQLQDGDQAYKVSVSTPASTPTKTNPDSFDPEFQNLDIANSFFNLRNTDNEQVSDQTNPTAPGVVYIASSGNTTSFPANTAVPPAQTVPALTTSESGGQDTFGIRLRSAPVVSPGNTAANLGTGYVTLSLSSPRPDEFLIINPVTKQPTSSIFITFFASTPAGGLGANQSLWNQVFNVTVVGVDDTANPLVDGNPTISLNVDTYDAGTSDTTYQLIDPADPQVTNVDNESTGFTITPSSLVVNEGASTTYTVRINSVPTSSVSLTLTSSNTATATVSPSVLTFDANNLIRTVTVTGVSDGLLTPATRNTTITGQPFSSDTRYNDPNNTKNLVPAQQVAVLNTDTTVATSGFTLTPSALVVNEGASTTYTVRINSTPTSTVTVTLANSAASAISISPAILTFDANNLVRTITVAGLSDGDPSLASRPATISGTAFSSDLSYNNVTLPDETVTVINTDTLFVISKNTVTTSESGTTDSFTVGLRTPPVDANKVATTVNVTLKVNSSPNLEAKLSSPAAVAPLDTTGQTLTLTFNSITPQTVTVTGINDNVADTDATYTITGVSTSPVASYSSVATPVITGTNTALVVSAFAVAPTTGLVTSEDGGTATFTVTLNKAPAAGNTVSFNLTAARPTEAVFSGGATTKTLTFTAANFSTPQIVTLVGVDDTVDDDVQTFTITGTITSSLATDTSFVGLTFPTVSGINNDNDGTPGTNNGSGAAFAAGSNNLVSYPYLSTLGAVTAKQAFGSMTSSGVTRYTLYRFNAEGQVGNLGTFSSLGTDWVAMSEASTLNPGEGYLLRVGTVSVAMNTPADDPTLYGSTAQSLAIALKRNVNFKKQTRKSDSFNGYNLIGFPFNPALYSAVNLSTAQFVVATGKTKAPFKTYETLAKAAGSGAIKGRVFTLNANGALTQLPATAYTLNRYGAVFVQTFRDTGIVQIVLRNPS